MHWTDEMTMSQFEIDHILFTDDTVRDIMPDELATTVSVDSFVGVAIFSKDGDSVALHPMHTIDTIGMTVRKD